MTFPDKLTVNMLMKAPYDDGMAGLFPLKIFPVFDNLKGIITFASLLIGV
jgi:hypothetical protein